MKSLTVGQVLRDLAQNPVEYLIRRWNWKSAVTSAVIRGGIFFSTNVTAGYRAALGAMLAEFIFRIITSGFYGSLTQAFRKAEPPWAAALAAMVLLPLCSHSLEFLLHWMRGTPALFRSMMASVAFTAISTLFNLYAMRQGALIVGDDRKPLWDDLKAMPHLVVSFLALAPRAIWKAMRNW